MIALEFPSQKVDPIAALVEARGHSHAKPSPLVRMELDLTVKGALAVVEAKRTYRNTEEKAIEALLTIPVPVQAAFFRLTANIGGRLLKAEARAADEARDEYEDAIDSGKAAVLHEELLRGVHMLSVANVMPGTTVEVTTTWAESLRCDGSRGRLRIPLTVGQVYGVSGLSDSDELESGGAAVPVGLRVAHDSGSAKLADGDLTPSADGLLRAEVPANAPIDLAFEDWRPGMVEGRARDGRAVSVSFEPMGGEGENLSLAVLVDRSGSMSSPCAESPGGECLTKHDVVRQGLKAFAARLRASDRLSLWEFDHACREVGSRGEVGPREFASLVDQLMGPEGGTEIGGALNRVIRSSRARDILLITDGKSYALDVQRLAQKGRRIFAVLVGEDSLEAKVGHLAALTGGDTHFTFGRDIGTALRAALQALRSGRALATRQDPHDVPDRAGTIRGNVKIAATWSFAGRNVEGDMLTAAVAAFATSLALPSLEEAVATRLATEEGLVTHLTSLILVDQDGERNEGLPVTRKVRPPAPRLSRQASIVYSRARRSVAAMAMPSPASIANGVGCVGFPDEPDFRSCIPAGRSLAELFHSVGAEIDWDEHADALASGDLTGVSEEVSDGIQDLAGRKSFVRGGLAVGLDPLRLVVATLAVPFTDMSRSAMRVLRRLLRGVDREAFRGFVGSLVAAYPDLDSQLTRYVALLPR